MPDDFAAGFDRACDDQAARAEIEALEGLPAATVEGLLAAGERIDHLRRQLARPANSQRQAPAAGPTKRVPAAVAHENRILDALTALGYRPDAMPPRRQGARDGVKRLVFERLRAERQPITEAQFRKAWQSLLDAGRIVQPVG